MEKITERNKAIIFTGLAVGGVVIGFVLGCMFTHYNYVLLVSSLQIEHITIQLNESNLVDLIYDKVRMGG